MNLIRGSGQWIPRITGDPIAMTVLYGVALRIVVFCFLSPMNNDGPDHLEYVRYVAETRSFPPSGWNNQAYQPPLYYWLASLFYISMKDAKSVQVFSLFCSIETVVVYGLILRGTRLIASQRARFWIMSFISFCPQFVMFSLYVSNDALAMATGATIAYAVCRSSCTAFGPRRFVLAGLIGLGLLVKLTFLIYAILYLAFRIAQVVSKRSSWKRGIVGVVSTAAIIALLGNYKYYENYINYRNIIICNLDFHPDWAENQKGTYRGIDSFLDCSIHKLILNPIVSSETKRSLPLTLYGTLWYQYIGESNFMGSSRSDLRWIGSAINLFGIVPVLMCVAGILIFLHDICRQRISSTRASSISFLIAAFLGNVMLIVAAVLRYDVWSVMQARLFFPSIFGALSLFYITYQKLEPHPRMIKSIDITLSIIIILFMSYYVSEILQHIL